MKEHEENQDPETEAAKWNSAIIHFSIYTCYTISEEKVMQETTERT